MSRHRRQQVGRSRRRRDLFTQLLQGLHQALRLPEGTYSLSNRTPVCFKSHWWQQWREDFRAFSRTDEFMMAVVENNTVGYLRRFCGAFVLPLTGDRSMVLVERAVLRTLKDRYSFLDFEESTAPRSEVSAALL